MRSRALSAHVAEVVATEEAVQRRRSCEARELDGSNAAAAGRLLPGFAGDDNLPG